MEVHDDRRARVHGQRRNMTQGLGCSAARERDNEGAAVMELGEATEMSGSGRVAAFSGEVARGWR